MGKRFTATEKWDKDWFQNLSCLHKCLIQYLWDKCDQAGVWEPNFRLASFLIGEPVSEKDLDAFGPRIVKLENGKFLVVKFIHFQYGELSPDCRPHAPVFASLKKNGLTPDFLDQQIKGIDTLTIGLANPTGKGQDKDKDKDKDKEGSPEGETLPEKTEMSEKAKQKLTAVVKINSWFKRRPETKWNDKEVKRLNEIMEDFSDEDFRVLDEYYTALIPGGCDYRRRDIQTLLNNWNGEVDRARKWKAEPTLSLAQANGKPHPRIEVLNAEIARHYAYKRGLTHGRFVATGGIITDEMKSDLAAKQQELERLKKL